MFGRWLRCPSAGFSGSTVRPSATCHAAPTSSVARPGTKADGALTFKPDQALGADHTGSDEPQCSAADGGKVDGDGGGAICLVRLEARLCH